MDFYTTYVVGLGCTRAFGHPAHIILCVSPGAFEAFEKALRDTDRFLQHRTNDRCGITCTTLVCEAGRHALAY